ncbi:MAG: ATP-binding cassette domain-containing protein [Actinomycetota bacterium]|nr:ATP-binding cassette domain-containing protein [Actinomycetota bacterium]
MSPAPVPLEARGLHRFHRRGGTEVAALLDVGLRVDEGESVAVMGPSGSGKSTLLSLLAGTDQPDGGSVHVEGSLLSHVGDREATRLRARHIGVLTQSGGLLGHLSVLDNVRLAASLRPTRPAGRTVMAPEEVLEALGLAAVGRARPATLSGGEAARAGLAVALAGTPTILLADEPTAEISADEETSLLDLLSVARPADGATVIVTHSAAVAQRADRVIRLLDGRLTPTESS